MTTEPTQSRVSRKIKHLFRYFLVAALIAIVIVAAKYFNVQVLIRTALMWIDNLGTWKPIAFIIIYNLATVLFVPGSIVTMGGGAVFGVFWGSIYVFIASTLGAISAFMIGRYLSRDWVTKQLESHPKFKAIDEAVAKEGFKIVFLTRLSPVFPFNLLNYAFGVTQVSLKDYFLGSFGMIPGSVMYVHFGSLASECVLAGTTIQPTTPEAETMKWVMRIVGLIATVTVTIYITRIAKKALETKI